jgi:hypothetical protein
MLGPNYSMDHTTHAKAVSSDFCRKKGFYMTQLILENQFI